MLQLEIYRRTQWGPKGSFCGCKAFGQPCLGTSYSERLCIWFPVSGDQQKMLLEFAADLNSLLQPLGASLVQRSGHIGAVRINEHLFFVI